MAWRKRHSLVFIFSLRLSLKSQLTDTKRGISTATGAAAHNYTTLLISRIFLGIFEATIGPSLMLISSQWYTKSEQAPRFSFWYTGLGLGQILGGAISYGFQHVSSDGGQMAGWRIMFVTLGVVTVVIGIATVVFLPDTPMGAKWLSDGEKIALLRHVSVNQTGIENRTFRGWEIVEALMDPQVYLLLLSVVLVSSRSLKLDWRWLVDERHGSFRCRAVW